MDARSTSDRRPGRGTGPGSPAPLPGADAPGRRGPALLRPDRAARCSWLAAGRRLGLRAWGAVRRSPRALRLALAGACVLLAAAAVLGWGGLAAWPRLRYALTPRVAVWRPAPAPAPVGPAPRPGSRRRRSRPRPGRRRRPGRGGCRGRRARLGATAGRPGAVAPGLVVAGRRPRVDPEVLDRARRAQRSRAGPPERTAVGRLSPPVPGRRRRLGRRDCRAAPAGAAAGRPSRPPRRRRGDRRGRPAAPRRAGAGPSWRCRGAPSPSRTGGSRRRCTPGCAGFLNALAFPVQLLVRVVPADLGGAAAAPSSAGCAGSRRPALAAVGRDLAAFLRRLAAGEALLERRCYLVVPAPEAATGRRRGPARSAAPLRPRLPRLGRRRTRAEAGRLPSRRASGRRGRAGRALRRAARRRPR